MRTVHFYDTVTGVFTGDSFSFSGSRLDVLRANTPSGCRAYEGDVDFLSQRINPETGALISYQPPQPDHDHEWNTETRRWRKRASVIEREAQRAGAIAERDLLEGLQVRSISELLVNPDNLDARANFERRKARIDELRAVIAETETTERAG